MSKKTPIRVHIWDTKHKGLDVWKVAIDEVGGGPLTEFKSRYTRSRDAKRGALRKLKDQTSRGARIEFIYSKPAKR